MIHSQNSTVPAPNIKLVNFDRESDMTAGEIRTVKVVIAAHQMSVSISRFTIRKILPWLLKDVGADPGEKKSVCVCGWGLMYKST